MSVVVKVKIFSQNVLYERLVCEINDFIKDKKLISIQYSTNAIGSSNYGGAYHSAMVVYEEKENEK